MYICSMCVSVSVSVCTIHVTLQLKPHLSSLGYWVYVVESDSVFLGEPFIARLLKQMPVLTI